MDFNLADSCRQLRRAPGILRALVEPLPEAWLHATDGPGTWSPVRVVRHLMWCEVDDWIPRARTILEHQERVAFTPFDRDGGEARFGGMPIGELLDEFARLREANVATLDGFALDDRALALPGRHPELGAVTLQQLLATWVAHDLVHVTQISRTLARQFREAVGPWREFMSVMKPG